MRNQRNQRRPAVEFKLRTDRVEAHLLERRITHAEFADSLALSRSYWSALLNRKRTLSVAMRRRLIKSEALRDLPEEQLWDRVDARAAGGPVA